MRKEHVSLSGRKDQHLALLCQIHVIDKSACTHVHPLHLCILRIHAADGHTTDVAFSLADTLSLMRYDGHHRCHLMSELLSDHIHITLIQLDGTSLTHSIIGHGGASAKHMYGIECKLLGILFKGVYHTISCTLQYDDQKDTAGHSKPCGHRAQLVHAYGMHHLSESVGQRPLEVLEKVHALPIS